MLLFSKGFLYAFCTILSIIIFLVHENMKILIINQFGFFGYIYGKI